MARTRRTGQSHFMWTTPKSRSHRRNGFVARRPWHAQHVATRNSWAMLHTTMYSLSLFHGLRFVCGGTVAPRVGTWEFEATFRFLVVQGECFKRHFCDLNSHSGCAVLDPIGLRLQHSSSLHAPWPANSNKSIVFIMCLRLVFACKK
jgi:hypothetical protein